MKLTTMALIGAGYVLGARAGHERYEQIAAKMEAASHQLEAFSARAGAARGNPDRPSRPAGKSR